MLSLLHSRRAVALFLVVEKRNAADLSDTVRRLCAHGFAEEGDESRS